MAIPGRPASRSGDRFRVHYRIRGPEAEALATARDICLEQTVEIPASLVPPGDVADQIVGRIEGFESTSSGHFRATISYASECAGAEITQLLNVIFGNYSLKPGVQVEGLDLPEPVLQTSVGPRFGQSGLRALLGVTDRPLLATALKPLGLSTTALADLAYRLALGGIDVIKDDHGLANQPFAPFPERVERCVEAVARANRQTGGQSIYVPNVTAPGDLTLQRARFAARAGAGGLLVSPGLAGLGALTQLAADEQIARPILSHPAFLGSFVTCPENGIAPGVLFGQIVRLAGADATIYPNYGGRFSFRPDDCRAIVVGATAPLGMLKPIFPMPGGGMSLDRVAEMLDFYGSEVILLIGGALQAAGPDLVATARRLRQMVDERFG